MYYVLRSNTWFEPEYWNQYGWVDDRKHAMQFQTRQEARNYLYLAKWSEAAGWDDVKVVRVVSRVF